MKVIIILCCVFEVIQQTVLPEWNVCEKKIEALVEYHQVLGDMTSSNIVDTQIR